ncbi:unnamed protein product [Vitrella brassicaformis CCMP3155]|uniref:GH16 domain-containing protein n=1 Tax=Vitrella brassicaformis (strain CCMP3155) TaxID=1169540 RepID=A0A0G4GPB3_VITBC|nr:unnamed protein product [Vitrella brassicaformis CCMP3155]|eukprot:CEM32144.1 unnamed protein product [Vitrella brassicaformis CCMP3155]
MHLFGGLLLLLLLLLIALSTGELPLAFDEQFEGSLADIHGRWTLLDECPRAACRTPDQVWVQDGQLHLRMTHREQPYEKDGKHIEFDVGGVVTKESMGFGYYEARVKFTSSGGFWQAFWLNASPNSVSPVPGPRQEHDIVEYIGGHEYIEITIWRWSPRPYEIVGKSRLELQQPRDYDSCLSYEVMRLSRSFTQEEVEKKAQWEGDPEQMVPGMNSTMMREAEEFNPADWHTYGMLYTPQVAFFYLDGFPVRKFDLSSKFSANELRRQYTFLTSQVTDTTAEEVTLPPGGEPEVMYVDHFKYYKLPGVQPGYAPYEMIMEAETDKDTELGR